ncbi:ABC transporter ATP-binding protein [Magnetospira sp. QH-2]|uniref:ABC transporter ATP-binding protein n=1 Tax=Magnetospira sp. (strain QH-2) TaxID=1288970 RepID=UPI0003E81154|nr:ABC transporter ATP-binding protein [Magnetospira sp. QH-2]CCQ74559.1 High-affinity branched-chain amino acid transport protein (ABC superfamily, ATP-binding) [Magnetospira sp. QH-2]
MTLLRVEGLNKEFGGVHAIAGLTFAIESGTIHSIIGPNGAGKTTLFNLITGIYVPTSGRIFFNDQEVTAHRSSELAARGMSRTFQNLQVFFNMTALENVMVGAHLHLNRGFFPALFGLKGIRRADKALREEAADLMRFVGLDDFVGADADAMPYGALKRLEIARALAARPKMLLLDEPAAGLNPTESREVDDVIRRVAEQGITVVLVEHDMRMVMGISDHILVLDYGRKLTEGTVDKVRNDPEVISAYLGGQA